MSKVLRPSARAIVLRDEHILIMKRTKHGRRYMVTPGGRIEDGETAKQAVIREVAEETTITITNPRLVFVEDPQDSVWGLQYVYLCDYVDGEPSLPEDSEEFALQQKMDTTYEPVWLPIEQLSDRDYPFKSEKLREEILVSLPDNFPEHPKRWTLQTPVLE